jgi:hypothetical protein
LGLAIKITSSDQTYRGWDLKRTGKLNQIRGIFQILSLKNIQKKLSTKIKI